MPDIDTSLTLSVFIPTISTFVLIAWFFRIVYKMRDQIGKHITEWHETESAYKAHEALWKRFTESDAFRERMAEQIEHKIDSALTPIHLKMDLLEKNVRLALSESSKDVRELLDKFRAEVLVALTKLRDTE